MNTAAQTDELIARFENASVDPETFDHREHVHVAWCYLQRHDVFAASDRFATALRRLVLHLGVPEKFNATVTGFFMLMTAERMRSKSAQDDDADLPRNESWEEFCQRNPDLIGSSSTLLRAHYSPERLQSNIAKVLFVLPDRCGPSE